MSSIVVLRIPWRSMQRSAAARMRSRASAVLIAGSLIPLLPLVTRGTRGERLSRDGLVGCGLSPGNVAVAAGVNNLRPPEPPSQECGDRRHQQRAHDQGVE